MILKAEGIHFYTTNSEVKASIVERFNRTLKSPMQRYFTWKNTLKYIDILPQLVKAYNHSYHCSIGMKPAEVNGRNESIVWKRLYTYTTYILHIHVPYYSCCLYNLYIQMGNSRQTWTIHQKNEIYITTFCPLLSYS